MSLTVLLAQEENLQFDRFDQATAWALGCALKARAETQQAQVAIEIYAFGQVVFSYAMPGTFADNQDWIRRKRQSVLRFGHSSLYLGRYHQSKNRVFEEQPHIDASLYCAHGGSFPLRLKGSGLIGAVTVSGLPQEADHQLVVETLEALLLEGAAERGEAP